MKLKGIRGFYLEEFNEDSLTIRFEAQTMHHFCMLDGQTRRHLKGHVTNSSLHTINTWVWQEKSGSSFVEIAMELDLWEGQINIKLVFKHGHFSRCIFL